MSNKLHEILAIEQDRKHKANLAIGEAKKVFTKNQSVFDGMIKQYVPMEEMADQIPEESKQLESTVMQLLTEKLKPVIVAMDATLSKEETNASNLAKAELKVGEKSFGEFSATTLLALESYLGKVQDIYASIPVLDTSRKFTFDEQLDYYRSDVEVKFRSIKRPKVIVKYEATDKHPAQTEIMNIDFQVGKYETTYFSGRITPTQKNRLLDRLEKLIEAVKVARSRANNVEVNQIKLGQDLFDFIHGE
ncbi:MAG: hypothetical protein AAFY71_20870 [Bacteroidota bacterium]